MQSFNAYVSETYLFHSKIQHTAWIFLLGHHFHQWLYDISFHTVVNVTAVTHRLTCFSKNILERGEKRYWCSQLNLL